MRLKRKRRFSKKYTPTEFQISNQKQTFLNLWNINVIFLYGKERSINGTLDNNIVNIDEKRN